MADYVKTSLQDISNLLPSYLDDAQKWSPKLNFRNAKNFHGEKLPFVFFNAKTGKVVEDIVEQVKDPKTGKVVSRLVTAGQQVVADRLLPIAERQIVSVVRESTTRFGMKVLDSGIRPPISGHFVPPKLQVPPFPWEMKLSFTPGEMDGAIKRLRDLAPPLPAGFGKFNQPILEPAAVAEWSVQAAERFFAQSGIDMPPELRSMFRAGAVTSTYEVLQTLPSSMQKLGTDMMDGLSNISAVATTQFWGAVDWSKGVQGVIITVDALRDGMVTKEEAKNIGAAYGAFIGGAIGSVFGPVGTLIGSAVGTLVGMLVGAIAGEKQGASKEWLAAEVQLQSQRKALEQSRKEVEELQSAAQKVAWISACRALSQHYYEALRAYMEVVALLWAESELEIGWRFDLRWFDPNPGINFETLVKRGAAHPSAIQVYAPGPLHSTVRWVKTDQYQAETQGLINPGKRGQVQHRFEVSSGEYHTQCPHNYGCPYPDPDGYDVPVFLGTFYQATGKRVAQAFAARGFYWKNPDSRLSCDDLFGGSDLSVLMAQVDRLTAAAKLLQMDVIRTATAVKTEHDMWANGAIWTMQGLDTGAIGKASLEQAVRTGKNRDPQVLAQAGYSGLRTAYTLEQLLWWGGLGALGVVAVDRMRGKQ
jgi:outer membrane lipoprotein SlyB